MGWKDKAAEWGGANLTFLSEDGESVIFVVVGEPELIEGKFRGKETRRVGIPIATLDGFSLLVIGMRVFRKLAKYEEVFAKSVFELTRDGEPGDTATKYPLKVFTDDKDLLKQYAAVRTGVDLDEIKQAVKDAYEAATG